MVGWLVGSFVCSFVHSFIPWLVGINDEDVCWLLASEVTGYVGFLPSAFAIVVVGVFS